MEITPNNLSLGIRLSFFIFFPLSHARKERRQVNENGQNATKNGLHLKESSCIEMVHCTML